MTCNLIYFFPDFRALKNEDFDLLSKEIVELFPNELAAVYYLPPIRKRFSKDKKAGISRGKLVDKYRNKLTYLRKTGLLPSSASKVSSDVEDRENNSGKQLFYDGSQYITT